MSRSILFYAIPEEQKSALSQLEQARPIKYIRTGLYDAPEAPVYSSFANIPSFATTSEGVHVRLPEFLIVDECCTITPRTVSQKKGGVKYAFYGMQSTIGVAVRFCSIFSERLLVYGSIVHDQNPPESREFYKQFRSYFLRDFRKIKSFVVSPGATDWQLGGGRLAAGAKADPSLDLVIPEKWKQ